MTREEAILCLKGMKIYGRDTFTEQTDWQTSLDMAIEALEQEPKTGHWIWCVGSHKCSNCEEYTCFSHKELLRYCPNCGAKMVEPQESDHKCHTCKHYTSGEHDGSCGSYICKEYSNWESEDKE